MAAQKFLVRDGGKTRQKSSVDSSAGAGDAGKLVALDSAGLLDESMLPVGIGANVNILPSTESFSAGDFVNIFDDGGTVSVRLADNSNGRQADGFVLAVVTSPANATVYPLGEANTELSTLTLGAEYWLGTAGGVTDTPLDATDAGNANKVCQYLGKAVSATELKTVDHSFVIL